MRFNAAFASALVSSASLMGYAHAEEAEKQPDVSSVVEKPTFTVSCASIVPPPQQHQHLLTWKLADQPEGTFPRTIHRGLGIQMDCFPRQKGRLQDGRRLGLCR